MIVGTSTTIQISGGLAHDLFGQLGVTGTSAMRFAIAAVVLLVVVRPSLRGRTSATWRSIVLYGCTLAMLNICFFQSIERIPMGIAVTLAFLGPVVMAITTSRRPVDVVWVLLASPFLLRESFVVTPSEGSMSTFSSPTTRISRKSPN